MKINQNSL